MDVLAKTWRIRRRPNGDPLAFVAPSDFWVARQDVVDGQEIWDKTEYSLYCLDPKQHQVVFVEMPDRQSFSDYPFHFVAQRTEAKQVVTMSFDDFHDLVERQHQESCRLLMIHTVGRSGSTLLAQMMAQLDNCSSYSEPDYFTQLVELDCSAAERCRWLRNCMSFLCRAAAADHLVAVKFRSFVMELAGDLRDTFPHARTLFLYRDADAYVRSAMQAFRYEGSPLSWFEAIHSWRILHGVLRIGLRLNRSRLSRYVPKADDYSEREIIQRGPVGFLVLMWLSVMRGYLQFHPQPTNDAAIRYEDFVRDSGPTIEKILRLAELPSSLLPLAVQACRSDSQQHSVLAQSNRREWEPSIREQELIHAIIDEDSLIDSSNMQMPSTL